MLRIHRIVPNTRVEGPGVRFCIWVQGCHNRCSGCFARDTWDPRGGTWMEISELIENIRREKDHIEGITLLGGEPMEQAGALAKVAQAAREMGLGVITFTGRVYEQLLEQKDPQVLALLAQTDLLIDGPYRAELPEKRRALVGSENQRFLFLTDRYDRHQIQALQNGFEVRIDPDGRVRVNGMGDLEKLERYLKDYK